MLAVTWLAVDVTAQVNVRRSTSWRHDVVNRILRGSVWICLWSGAEYHPEPVRRTVVVERDGRAVGEEVAVELSRQDATADRVRVVNDDLIGRCVIPEPDLVSRPRRRDARVERQFGAA